MPKVCILGHFDSHPEEGVRKVTLLLSREAAKHCEVSNLSFNRPHLWYKIAQFKPEIVHCILSPSNSGLVLAGVPRLFHPRARTIVSALHPWGLKPGRSLKFSRSDLVLCQSQQSEQLFQALGLRTSYLPSGVDLAAFAPRPEPERAELRKKYGVPQNAFVALHVASLKRARNLEVLRALQSLNAGIQVLIVGRTAENTDQGLVSELRSAGCLLWMDYLPRIQEVFALSDCYVFPTRDRQACVETPLSVLEAMSCNLPVVSTPFGALPRMFSSGDGLFFVERDEDIPQIVLSIKAGMNKPGTREKVEPYSWENIGNSLAEIYRKILEGGFAQSQSQK